MSELGELATNLIELASEITTLKQQRDGYKKDLEILFELFGSTKEFQHKSLVDCIIKGINTRQAELVAANDNLEDWKEKVCSIFVDAPRYGAEEDYPEGAQWIQLSSTLVRNLVRESNE